MKPLRVAIVGCGSRAQAHAKAALAGGVTEIAWACDIVPERADAAAEKWGAQASYDHREVLADPSVEAVHVVTNVDAHFFVVVFGGGHYRGGGPFPSEKCLWIAFSCPKSAIRTTGCSKGTLPLPP